MAITFLSDPANVANNTSPATDGNWNTVDVSAHVSASATGAILHCYAAATGGTHGIAATDSTLAQRWTPDSQGSKHWMAFVKLNASGQFLRKSDTSYACYIDIVGYTEDECVLFADPVVVTTADSTWATLDISAHVGGDTAIGVIVEGNKNNASTWNTQFGLRATSGTTVVQDSVHCGQAFLAPVASNQCEVYQTNGGAGLEGARILGYIKDTANITFETPPNAYDLKPSVADTWEATSTLPSTATGAFVYAHKNNLGGTNTGIRRVGSSYTRWAFNFAGDTEDSNEDNFVCASACNASGQVEMWGDATTYTDLTQFLVAYTTDGGAPPPPAPGTNTGKNPVISMFLG